MKGQPHYSPACVGSAEPNLSQGSERPFVLERVWDKDIGMTKTFSTLNI